MNNVDKKFRVVRTSDNITIASKTSYTDIIDLPNTRGILYQILFSISKSDAIVNLTIDDSDIPLLDNFNLKDFESDDKIDFSDPKNISKHPMFSWIGKAKDKSNTFLLDLTSVGGIEIGKSLNLQFKKTTNKAIKVLSAYYVMQFNQ
jgi:hypothetical protein